MISKKLVGNWEEQKEKLKQKFAILTEKDLLLEKGKREELIEQLQIKLGKTKLEIQKILSGI